jgi:hypothetical protein
MPSILRANNNGMYRQAFLPSLRSGGLKDGELDYISQINILDRFLANL